MDSYGQVLIKGKTDTEAPGVYLISPVAGSRAQTELVVKVKTFYSTPQAHTLQVL